MLVSKALLNRGVQRQCLSVSSRFLATAVADEKSSSKPQKFFRTSESSPAKHGELDSGLFYTIPQDVANRLFSLGGWDKEQQAMIKCFRETSVMVRQPALAIVDQLKTLDLSKQSKRFVLHGRVGTGKTMTMNHVLHYGHENKFVIIYCGRPTDWTRFPQEYSVSSSESRRIDTPLEATVWLQHFKFQNLGLLEELSLKCINKYTWSSREVTEAGEPLLAIVEHGINRVKHSSDCVAALLKELKLNSTAGKCRLMVAIEKVNALYESCDLRYPDRTIAQVENVTLARAFKKFITEKDWTNGVVISITDKKLVVPYRILPIDNTQKKLDIDKKYRHWGPFNVSGVSDRPEDLLTEQGMEDFSPCEMIPVEKYSDKELMSCLDYYEDRLWIQRPAAKTPEGREEIRFLTGNNPDKVYELCCGL